MPEEVPHHLACRAEGLLVGSVDGVRHAVGGGIHDGHEEGAGRREGVHIREYRRGLDVHRKRLRLLHLGCEHGFTEGGREEGRKEGKEGERVRSRGASCEFVRVERQRKRLDMQMGSQRSAYPRLSPFVCSLFASLLPPIFPPSSPLLF